MIVSLDGDVEINMFNKLIDSYNENTDDQLHIYLNSRGGDVSIGFAIIDFINERKDNIEIIGYGELLSMVFHIFFETTCKKRLIRNTIGMTHLSSCSYNLNSNKNMIDSSDKIYYANMKESDEEAFPFLENLSLNKNELKSIKNGKDVYFNYKRMQELLKHQNGKI